MPTTTIQDFLWSFLMLCVFWRVSLDCALSSCCSGWTASAFRFLAFTDSLQTMAALVNHNVFNIFEFISKRSFNFLLHFTVFVYILCFENNGWVRNWKYHFKANYCDLKLLNGDNFAFFPVSLMLLINETIFLNSEWENLGAKFVQDIKVWYRCVYATWFRSIICQAESELVQQLNTQKSQKQMFI